MLIFLAQAGPQTVQLPPDVAIVGWGAIAVYIARWLTTVWREEHRERQRTRDGQTTTTTSTTCPAHSGLEARLGSIDSRLARIEDKLETRRNR
jgi:Flp pilus assembly protein TadB